jgi:adenylate cyclase
MATEIERKFLVKGNFKHLAIKEVNILQYYLSIDLEKTMRIRFVGNSAYLTIKGKAPVNSITRNEGEFEIPVGDANDIVKLCYPGKIEKTRYYVPSGQHIFEVDVFHGNNKGLIIAELELKSETEEFARPDWLGEEVTGIPGYYNANLIK